MAQPLISFCLVVKDEELFVRECLESVKPVADELIVVDTGSGDRTMAIARELGAQVFQEPWPGDLARAHDLPLQRATGDWILTLDGDEALDSDRGAELRELVRKTPFDGFGFTIRNYHYRPAHQHRPAATTDPCTHGACSWSPSTAVRLFRNRPEFRNRGRVHQTVLDAMTNVGARVSTTSVPIHHYGYLRTDRAKSCFYADLAERQVSDRPRDAKARIELGMVYLGSQRYDAALRAFEKAGKLGNIAESSFFVGVAQLEKRNFVAAADALSRAIGAARDLRFFADEADVWELLGQARIELDEPAAAEQAFRSALKLRPDSPESEARLVLLLASGSRFDEAAVAVGKLTERYPGLAISWEASGCNALLAGSPAAAIGDFKRALDIDPERSSSRFNLGLAYAHAGNERLARQVLDRAVATDRENRLPAAARELARPAPAGESRRLGPRGVLSFIPHLCGGAAYVACELVAALAPERPQIVATLDPGDFTGEAHHESPALRGVPVLTVANAEDLAALQVETEPGVIVHHWWRNEVLDTITRRGGERLVLRSASPLPMPPGYDRYVTLSGFQEQYQSHIPANRRERIPNGVDLEFFGGAAPREAYWSDFAQGAERPVRIAMVSRLDPDKFTRRLADYLEPLRDVPAAVAIAGRGARRWEIEPELRRRGLAGWIRFLGPVPQHEIPGFLAGADIGLHLTETHQESLSLTVLQMLAAGLPVVAQPRGCLPELIADGETGFLAFGESRIATLLRRLILDPELRRRCGRAARRSARAFSTEQFARRWRELIDNLCAARDVER